jgi:hypothetical protein
MFWNATIAFLELFVLPASAAVAASLLLVSDRATGKAKIIQRLCVVVVVSFAAAFAAQYFRMRSNKPSSMILGENLAIVVQRSSSQLTLKYDMLLYGDSALGFTIVDLTGALETISGFQPALIPFALNDFECLKDGKHFDVPAKIEPGSSINLNCTVKIKMTPAQTTGFVAAGDHKLKLRVASNSSNELAGAFCFVFTPDAVSEFTASGNLNKRFLDANC